MTTKPLKKIDKYHLVRELGKGGVAEVYLARYSGQEKFQKEFAIKLLLPEMAGDEEIVNMLIDEAKIQAQLDHDNIVRVYELGAIDKPSPAFFIVMEYVDGKNLRTIMKQMANNKIDMPLPYKLHIIHEILKGLDFAHTRCDRYNEPLGIVHRDISPHNILISNQGSVKITDFGIAKAKQHFRKTEKTEINTLKGKYAYMSPEQVRGQVIDHTSDLFAVGIILFELITGQRAFYTGNNLQTMDLVRHAKYPESALKNVDPALSTIIRKALAEDKCGRYGSAHEFAEAVWKYMQLNSYYVTERDLGKFIGKMFSDGKLEPEKDLKTPPPAPTVIQKEPLPTLPPPIVVKEPRGPAKHGSAFYFLVAALLLIPAIALFSIKKKEAPAAPSPKITVSLAPVKLGPDPPPPKPAVVKEPKQIIEYGILSIVAQPWAYVSVPKITNKAETPFFKKLQAGSYKVTLWNPASGEDHRAEKEVTIHPSKTTKCFANFEAESPAIKCQGGINDTTGSHKNKNNQI